MRKQKITKFYHTALILAGIPRQDIETFTFHGLRRTAVTMQMEYGDNLPEEEVMKATRHTSTRCFRLYNQESAQKQARHTSRDTEIAYLTGVVSDWRKANGWNIEPNPVEVAMLRTAIQTRGLTVQELRTDKLWTSKDVINLLLQSKEIKEELLLQQ